MRNDSISEIVESVLKNVDNKTKARVFCRDVQRLGRNMDYHISL